MSFGQKVDYGKLLVEAINSPDTEKQRELVSTIFSEKALSDPGLEPIMGVVSRWHGVYAPLDFHHSEINEFPKQSGIEYVLHVYARKKGDIMFKDFQIYLDPNTPHKLQKIAFIADVAEPVNLPNGTIEQQETLHWLTRYADKLNLENGLYGSYRILKGSWTLFDKQYGYEDADKKIPITKNTIFNLASGGKMFTAVAIAQLVEGGKLNYDEPITKYVNGFSDTARADRITISNLLSHTSGLAHYWTGENNQEVFSATTINEHLKIVYAAGVDFDAGTKYEYNNSNFIVLGAIIEKVTGKSFYDYVQINIFNRANMQSAGYFIHGTMQVASGLVEDGEHGWKPGRLGGKGSSAGGAYATLGDIEKFAVALRNNTLIQKETLTNMISVKNKGMDVTEDYGYGFILSRLGGEFGYGHGGTANGVNFEFNYYPRQDITLIMFCNQNNGAYDDLKKNIIKLITGYR